MSTHKGVRIVLRIDGLTVIDIDSLEAHHVAAFEGGTYSGIVPARGVELVLTACETDDALDDDE